MCDYSFYMREAEECIDPAYQVELDYIVMRRRRSYERKLGRELTPEERYRLRRNVDEELNPRHPWDKQPGQNLEMAKACKAWGVKYSEIPF